MIVKPLLAIGLAAAMALGAGVAQAQTSQPQSKPAAQAGMQKTNAADQQFIKEAIQINLAEISVGKLAQQQGQADDVKQFGQMLEQDHAKNLQDAQQVAQQIGVTPPAEPNAEQKAMGDKLQKASGAQFDREFKQDMIKGHRAAIALFRKEAKKPGAVGQYAQQTLPGLEKHLKTAQALGKPAPTTGAK